MTDTIPPPPSPIGPPPSQALFRFPARSLGLKFVLVCFLALLMAIPALFVSDIAKERARYAQGVAQEIGALRGGPQVLSGPILIIPYTREVALQEQVQNTDGTQRTATRSQIERGYYAHFAETGAIDASLTTEVLKRSIYKVPAFIADTKLRAAFDLSSFQTNPDPKLSLDWPQAKILMQVSDLRGAKNAVSLVLADGRSLPFEPSSDPALSGGAVAVANPAMAAAVPEGAGGGLQAVTVNVGEFAKPGAKFSVSAAIKLSGVDRFSVPAFANDTVATLSGAWDDPKFEGAFLPDTRQVNEGRFTATWRAPFLARGLPRGGLLGSGIDFSQVNARDFAVTLIQRSEVYAGVDRALRYGLLFIGTVFLAYFLFEATGGGRAHPAQYLLVGLAQCVFYLLLLAFAEQVGFDIAFGVAALATVALSASYAGAVFKSRTKGIQAAFAFAFVYLLQFVLMRLEDFALLAGAVVAFAAIATVMWLTRNLDWYGAKAN
jgi:inner membrane protein